MQLLDVAVQGEQAVGEIVAAIDHFNQLPVTPEVLVITRGGGSAEDLAAFNTEQVTRAVAGSRIPTLVAIGHETDISLAELAADQRASTPSNAAQLLVPDKAHVLQSIKQQKKSLSEALTNQLKDARQALRENAQSLMRMLEQAYFIAQQTLGRQTDLLEALNPEAALKRGYAVIRGEKGIIRSVKTLKIGDSVKIKFHDGQAGATIDKVY